MSIFDGFNEWRTPTRSDYEAALKGGLVVLDTNVLLDMYRLEPAARAHHFNVMSKIETLWVPHQVLAEFWSNRDKARQHLRSSSVELQRSLGDSLREIDKLFREWANRAGLSDEEVEQLIEERAQGFSSTEERVRVIAEDTSSEQSLDTNNDDVLANLETLLADRVGPPLADEEHQAAIKEGIRRRENRIPPGFKDKSATSPSGDYLVWLQVLKQAQAIKPEYVLIVTGDVKEDWLEIVNGQRRGPRRELHRELHDGLPECRLLMTRLQNLVNIGETLYGIAHVTDQDEAAQEPEEIDEVSTDSSSDSQAGGELWTTAAFNELIARLSHSNPGRVSVLKRAVDNGGSVSRDEIYELLGRDPNKTLRAFTRPIRRITQQLRDEGILNLNAPDPIWPVYVDSVSYVKAARFDVLSSLQFD